MIETAGLTHIHLAVRDLARSLAFYTTVFGMKAMERDEQGMVFLRTPGAADTFTLRLAAPGEVVGSAGGLDHFGFRLKDPRRLDDAIREVVEAGGMLIERGEHAPGVSYAYVADPDGYVIEL
jgi:catechol 2,3-dioxygenase-like lactoylglutathione lyase family enzyme